MSILSDVEEQESVDSIELTMTCSVQVFAAQSLNLILPIRTNHCASSVFVVS